MRCKEPMSDRRSSCRPRLAAGRTQVQNNRAHFRIGDQPNQLLPEVRANPDDRYAHLRRPLPFGREGVGFGEIKKRVPRYARDLL